MAPVGKPKATEEHHPLEVLVCEECTLAQLSVIVDPEVVFPPEYPYSSGNSRQLHENFEDLARQASEFVQLAPHEYVIDIGANDGTLLDKFDSDRLLGIEPTSQAEKIGDNAKSAGYYQEFFTERLAQTIRALYGPAKIITACNVLAHVEDIHDVMRGITTLLADDGILVAENHDLASVVNGQWDTVYHEHLRFWSPHSFDRLLEMHGLSPSYFKAIPTHGGSFRMIATKEERIGEFPPEEYKFALLRQTALVTRDHIRSAARGVCGIGATARATTIINYCGLDVEDVEYVCEVPGSDKIGHCIPGTRIPVVDESRLLEDQQDAILFSWHMADVIVPKLREKGYKGEIIVPLPTPAYV